jgi:hypothetical protein
MPDIAPGDVVVCTNNDDLTFTFKWNKRLYPLKPGEPVFVPCECACSWLGDPRSVKDIKSYTGPDGLVAFIPDRATEVRRLRAKYGAVYGSETEFEGSYKDNFGEPGDPIYIPHVTVTTPDGEKLWMVVEDPHGEHSEAFAQTVSGHEDMLAQLRKQQAQINLLMDQLAGNTEGTPTISDDGDLEPPADDDSTPKAVIK